MRFAATVPALLTLAVAVAARGGGSHQKVGQDGYVLPPSGPQLTTSAAASTTAAGTPTTTASESASGPITLSSWNTPGTATWEAAQFVTAEKGYAWDQPGGVGGWAIKAKPYCNASYWATLDRQVQSGESARAARQGDSGDAAFWQQVQAEKETMFIDPTDAYVITEAGVTPTSVWVRVSYNTTDVTARNPDPAPRYGGQEDVIMSKGGSQWLVSGEGNTGAEG
jgi:hypothetical protein